MCRRARLNNLQVCHCKTPRGKMSHANLPKVAKVLVCQAQQHGCCIAGGYTELFSAQAAAWRVLAGGRSKAHDLCIAAPTGSGKTLAYALPLLHCLLG